ncbi:MAG: stage II sporulation protein E [Syntrophomonadaceae bacterium]|nr:stage II sporulation protein E [Syntrophomonadaceae bacterium]
MEKIEVYPYQRVSDRGLGRRVRYRQINKSLPKLNLHKGREQLIALFNTVKAAVIPINVVLSLVGFVLARAFVLGELLPFVFAFIAALGRRDRGRTVLLVASAALGMMTVTAGMQLVTNLVTLLLLAAIIQVIKIPAERQWWGYPLITCAFLIVCKGLFSVFQGPSFYQGMVVTFEALISGVLVFVFNVAGEAVQVRKALADFQFEDVTAFLIVAVGIAMGLNDIEALGLNAGSVFCRVIILLAAYLWGSGAATMVGVMAGLIPSLASSIFTQFLGMYALSGLLAGMFRSLGRVGIIVGFLLGNLALAMFVPETRMNVLGIWETAIACLLFVMLPPSLKDKLPLLTGSGEPALAAKPAYWPDAGQASVRSRMDELAGLFENLGRTFATHPYQHDSFDSQSYLHYLYDQVSQGICQNCVKHDRCWGQECYQTSQEILEVFALAEAEGVINQEQLPKSLVQKCLYLNDMVNTVQYLFDHLRINEYWHSKLKESRSLVSRQLSGISQIMRNLAREIEARPQFDRKLRDKLIKGCRERGLGIRDIQPWVNHGGQLVLHVEADACTDGKGCENRLVPVLSSLMGEYLSVSHQECPAWRGHGSCQLVLTPSHHYNVRCGAAQVGKEAVCGDSFTIATLKEGKQLVALSDGMGVGENASRESQAAIQLLEKLLGSGFGQDTSLQTINSVLLLRSRSETFATLDLVMIDLYTGQADFVKTGSAPSFIKRKGQVQVIAASSLPMGILEDIEVFREKISLYPGDMVVMLSDGVVEARPDAVEPLWIEEFLQAMDETDPQVLAEHIIHRALTLCHGKPLDDMTVICMALERNLNPFISS